MSKYIEEVIQEFENAFVNMSPMRGRDMHNRPPLYDTKTRDVEEMKQFIQSALQKQIEMIEGKVGKLNYVDSNALRMGDSRLQREFDKLSITNAKGYNQAIDDILSILNQYK